MDKYKMKFYESSALMGTNVEEMFFSIIDQINTLQQAKKKKIVQEEDDIMPPLTTENLVS